MKRFSLDIRSALLFASLAAVSCSPQQGTETGQTGTSEPAALRLPAGNADQGRKDFIEFDCHWCHRVKDVPLPDKDSPEGLMLPLDQHQLTQPQLLTAITNPEHVFSERYRSIIASPGANATETEPLMPSFVGTMTVRQLIDIVAFLEELPKQN